MDFTGLEERIDGREPIFRGKILNVQEWTVTLPNGKRAAREVALHNGASAVVPVDGQGNVYLVYQYRTPLERVMLEVPAGKLDGPGEDRLLAAKRELREETGFTARDWTHLVDLATTPGFCTEIISLYLARGLEKGDVAPDEDEFLDIARMPFEQAVNMALNGQITDAKTICALLLARERLGKEV